MRWAPRPSFLRPIDSVAAGDQVQERLFNDDGSGVMAIAYHAAGDLTGMNHGDGP
jgi:hypothetical protein